MQVGRVKKFTLTQSINNVFLHPLKVFLLLVTRLQIYSSTLVKKKNNNLCFFVCLCVYHPALTTGKWLINGQTCTFVVGRDLYVHPFTIIFF